MPYAVFEDGERVSRVFSSEADAWYAADRAGLVDAAKGKKVLKDGLAICSCDAEPEGSDGAESDFILS